MAHRTEFADTLTGLPAEAIAFLESLKHRAEHFRRFASDTPSGGNAAANLLCKIEGDIEEWLIEKGFWKSDED